MQKQKQLEEFETTFAFGSPWFWDVRKYMSFPGALIWLSEKDFFFYLGMFIGCKFQRLHYAEV